MKCVIVIKETSTGYSASSPDLEGCVATGLSWKEAVERMNEAIDFYHNELCGEDVVD